MSGDTLSLDLVLAAVGIIGGAIVSYYFYRISKKERRPVFFATSNVVVRGDEKRQIEVWYKGQEVPDVRRTVVAFWNAGQEPIRRGDVIDGHPLLISMPDGTLILDAQVIATTGPEIDFTCDPDDGQSVVNLDFSCLNHQDGGAVEILHAGTSRTLEMKGGIVGVKGPPSPRETSELTVPTHPPLSLFLALMSVVPVVLLASTYVGLFRALVGGAFAALVISFRLVVLIPSYQDEKGDSSRATGGS
jgi:hypothetical protein